MLRVLSALLVLPWAAVAHESDEILDRVCSVTEPLEREFLSLHEALKGEQIDLETPYVSAEIESRLARIFLVRLRIVQSDCFTWLEHRGDG